MPAMPHALCHRLKQLTPLVVFASVWLAWFGWHRYTSRVLPHESRYPSGAVKSKGLVKRQADGGYKRHGLWREFDESGRLRSETIYEDGAVGRPPRYFDERGQPVTSLPAATGANAPG